MDSTGASILNGRDPQLQPPQPQALLVQQQQSNNSSGNSNGATAAAAAAGNNSVDGFSTLRSARSSHVTEVSSVMTANVSDPPSSGGGSQQQQQHEQQQQQQQQQPLLAPNSQVLTVKYLYVSNTMLN